jgi:hypothetical protein
MLKHIRSSIVFHWMCVKDLNEVLNHHEHEGVAWHMTGIASDHGSSSFLGENNESRLFPHNSPR